MASAFASYAASLQGGALDDCATQPLGGDGVGDAASEEEERTFSEDQD
eukprot:COSAG02_NODE_66680_length_255_cov_0.141026_1_plen_47_part_10